jgi:hypothetical protein
LLPKIDVNDGSDLSLGTIVITPLGDLASLKVVEMVRENYCPQGREKV